MPKVSKQSPKGTRPTKKKAAGGKKPAGGILDQFVSGWDVNKSLSVLVYGQSGSGKTTFSSTFPGPILWLVCSGGSEPGELKSINTPAMKRKITPVVLRKAQDFLAVMDSGICNDFETVILDHGTGLQDFFLMKVMGLEDAPIQNTFGMAQRNDWMQIGIEMKEALRFFLSLSCNRVVVAQEREYNKEKESEDDLTKPYVSGSFQPAVIGWLSPACDYLCQTIIRPRTKEVVIEVGGKKIKSTQPVKGIDYCLRVIPDGTHQIKFRNPNHFNDDSPEFMVNPTYEKVQAIVEEER